MAHEQLAFRAEARENAVSVASVLLLTEATLTEIPEEQPAPPQPAEVM